MLSSLLRIAALIRKELLAILKDARTRNMLLIQPVIQLLIFGYAATLDLSNIPYGAFDRDRSGRASCNGSSFNICSLMRVESKPRSNRRDCSRSGESLIGSSASA